MQPLNLPSPPHTVKQKLLPNDTTLGANGSPLNAAGMGPGAQLGFLPPLQNALQSGSSDFRAPVVTSRPPLPKKGIISNLNHDKSVNFVERALAVTKMQETVLGQPAQLNADVEEGKKCKSGKGSRGGGTSRKRPRSGQTGAMDEVSMADITGGALVGRIGVVGHQCVTDGGLEKGCILC